MQLRKSGKVQKVWLRANARRSGFRIDSFHRADRRIADSNDARKNSFGSSANIEYRSYRLGNVYASRSFAIMKHRAVLFATLRANPKEIEARHVLDHRIHIDLQITNGVVEV